jgi:hypothetical protein
VSYQFAFINQGSRETRQRLEFGGKAQIVLQRLDQVDLDSGEALEEMIVEPAFANLVLEVFYRIEFGTVWRQPGKGEVVGNLQPFRLIPASLIHDHHHLFVGVATRGFA